MKKKLLLSLGLIVVIAASITIGAYAASDIKLWINGKEIQTDIQIVNGSSYVPLRVVSDELGADVKWDGDARTITITSKTETAPVATPTPAPKDSITSADLPYTIDASNLMSLTINSYKASSSGIIFNFTITNNSTVSDKGKTMTSTWDIYDGKNTLEYIDQDRIFFDSDELRSGQSVTGNVSYAGLSQQSEYFTLYGKLWQYVTTEEFKVKFKVE